VIAAVAEHHVDRMRDLEGGLNDHRAEVLDHANRGRFILVPLSSC